MLFSLDRMPDGQEGRLVRLEGERGFRRRLMELGLLPGTTVRVVRRAQIGGVLELEVRRSRLSVRMHEARSVYVEAAP